MATIQETFDEAYADCLKNCFEVLSIGSITDAANSEQRFRTCCDNCKAARKIAEKITGDSKRVKG